MKKFAKKGLIFLILFLLVFGSVSGCAPKKEKIYKIDVLIPTDAHLSALEGLKEGLSELGYVEGENIEITSVNLKGELERAKTLVGEKFVGKVDALITLGGEVTSEAVDVVGKKSGLLPIVFVGVGDPLGRGLIKSLKSSGNNLTGVVSLGMELCEKRMAIFKEFVPEIKRLAILIHQKDERITPCVARIEGAAQKLNLELVKVFVWDEKDLKEALKKINREAADGIFVICDCALFVQNLDLIAETAHRENLPFVTFIEESVTKQGALLSYGPGYYEMGKQSARLIDKVLKGQKPENIPVENPMTIRLVLNLKLAKELGLEFSEEVLNRVDKIVE